MNSPSNIPRAGGAGPQATADAVLRDLDATLDLLARLPVPAGLEDRVFAGVLATPRRARVLEWPRPFYARDWMRSIAAAAIVLAVGGGGWGIYEHVAQNEPARAVMAPRPMFHPGGFSSAEMIRRPQTLTGPVVKKAEPAAIAKASKAELTAAKKPIQTMTKPGQAAAKAQQGHPGPGAPR